MPPRLNLIISNDGSTFFIDEDITVNSRSVICTNIFIGYYKRIYSPWQFVYQCRFFWFKIDIAQLSFWIKYIYSVLVKIYDLFSFFVVLINGFNAEKEDAIVFAEFFKNLPTKNTTFEFLPYHEYGKNKWLKLGKPYKMHNAFVTQDTVKLFEDIFKSYNLKTIRS